MNRMAHCPHGAPEGKMVLKLASSNVRQSPIRIPYHYIYILPRCFLQTKDCCINHTINRSNMIFNKWRFKSDPSNIAIRVKILWQRNIFQNSLRPAVSLRAYCLQPPGEHFPVKGLMHGGQPIWKERRAAALGKIGKEVAAEFDSKRTLQQRQRPSGAE